MALKAQYLDYIEAAVRDNFSAVRGLHMLELGDQVVKTPDAREATGKEYFGNLGFVHTSVDMNGLHGALPLDLRNPEAFRALHDSFDVITNSGTTEHVEPVAKQYECFGILHDCLKVGGIAIHLNPDIDELRNNGSWRGHCTNFYSSRFYETLAAGCNYQLLSNTVINGLRCAVVKKAAQSSFMADREKFLSGITYVPAPFRTRLKEGFRAFKRKLQGKAPSPGMD